MKQLDWTLDQYGHLYTMDPTPAGAKSRTLLDSTTSDATWQEKQLMQMIPQIIDTLDTVLGRMKHMRRACGRATGTPAQFVEDWLCDYAGVQEIVERIEELVGEA